MLRDVEKKEKNVECRDERRDFIARTMRVIAVEDGSEVGIIRWIAAQKGAGAVRVRSAVLCRR